MLRVALSMAHCPLFHNNGESCMRVLLICEYASLNGGENSMLSVLPLLKSDGMEFHVAAPDSGDLAEKLSRIGVPVLPLRTWQGGKRVSRDELFTQIGSAVTQSKAEVMHSNSLSMSRLIGAAGGAFAPASIGHARDIMNLSSAAIRDVEQNDIVIAVSNATKKHLESLGIPDSKIVVVYNGIDEELFKPRSATKQIHAELKLPVDVRFVLIVGQLGMRKGVDDSLRAVEQIAADFPEVHVLVVGERHSQKAEAIEYERHLHVIASGATLAGRVHFLERRTDVNLLMNESEVLLHLAHQEPLGRVLLEAAASGCCVLASNVGGTSEIFPVDQFPKSLVSRSCPRQAADALRLLLADTARTKATALRMSEHIRTCFTSRQSAASIAEIYRTLKQMSI